MQKPASDKDRRKRLVAEIDRDLHERLQAERIVRGVPANWIVEEILASHFRDQPSVTIG
jgi:hypothetical protein